MPGEIPKIGLYAAGAFDLSQSDALAEFGSGHRLSVCWPLPLQPGKTAIFGRAQVFATQQVPQKKPFVNRLLPDQKKLALSGACRDLPVAFGGMPYLVAIEQQCFERIRDAVALVSNNFLKGTLNEGQRIARAGVQTNNVYMDMHVRPVSGQTAKKRSICVLT